VGGVNNQDNVSQVLVQVLDVEILALKHILREVLDNVLEVLQQEQ